jgi:hypothetical protein
VVPSQAWIGGGALTIWQPFVGSVAKESVFTQIQANARKIRK